MKTQETPDPKLDAHANIIELNVDNLTNDITNHVNINSTDTDHNKPTAEVPRKGSTNSFLAQVIGENVEKSVGKQVGSKNSSNNNTFVNILRRFTNRRNSTFVVTNEKQSSLTDTRLSIGDDSSRGNRRLSNQELARNDRRKKSAADGGGVQVVRFSKIEDCKSVLDDNNNNDVNVKDIEAAAVGEINKGDLVNGGLVVEQNGNENGTGVKKKMSDDDDDTRPINPRDPADDTPLPEVRTQGPNIINWWTWIAYSQGHVYNDLCASMWFTYLMPYLQKCVGLVPEYAGLLMLIGQVADAIATPIIGLFSDRGSTAWYCSLGRRKTWHILGTLLVTLSFPFIFSPMLMHITSALSQVLYYTPFICLFQFGWAAVQIAHLSLVPDLTPNEHERTSLLSVRYAFTVISNLLVYVVMYIAVESGEKHGSDNIGPQDKPKFQVKHGSDNIGPQDKPKFQYISYFVVGLGYLSTIIFYAGVSEIRNRQLQLDMRNSSSTQAYEAKKRTPRELLSMPTLYTVAVLYMTARMFFNTLQMFIVFYVQDTQQLSKVNIAVVPMVILISGFATSFVIKPMNVHWGRKVAHVIGLLLGILVSIIVFAGTDLIAGFKIYQVYIEAVLFGISSTIIQVTSFGMAADFVGDDVSNGAFIYGLLSFSDKMANGLVGYLIQKFNNNQGWYYRLALSYGCGLPCVAGLLALCFLPPIPQRRILNTQEEGHSVLTNNCDTSEDELEHSSEIRTQASDLTQD
uniref:Major facilitator superfamily domain-containing protein 12 n=1 Tax=Cacopsylla melanoneura TaxID=428564 RepID=A0A8D8WMV6_9HEMI